MNDKQIQKLDKLKKQIIEVKGAIAILEGQMVTTTIAPSGEKMMTGTEAQTDELKRLLDKLYQLTVEYSGLADESMNKKPWYKKLWFAFYDDYLPIIAVIICTVLDHILPGHNWGMMAMIWIAVSYLSHRINKVCGKG